MSLLTSNRLLVAVLLIGLGTACYSIPAILQHVKDAARAPVPEPPPPIKRLQKDSESSLKIETLRTLADSSSHELRTSAIKIVASRTIRSRARYLFLKDLAGDDHRRRDDAINALRLLMYNSELSESRFLTNELLDPSTVTGVVRALIKVLPLHYTHGQPTLQPDKEEHDLPPSPVRPANRPAQEVALLAILTTLIHNYSKRSSRADISWSMEAALRAGLVTRWLARYPFPCAQQQHPWNFKRGDVMALFGRDSWFNDDPLMGEILDEIGRYPRGRKQLHEAGLWISQYDSWDREGRERRYVFSRRGPGPGGPQVWAAAAAAAAASASATEDNDVHMIGGEDTAGLPGVWEETVPQPQPMTLPVALGTRLRSAERSQEEEHLRRRHREAIVVAERGAPLRRENILQRANSQILQPMNGVSEVEGVLNGLLGLSEDSSDGTSPTRSPDASETFPEDGRANPDSDGEDDGVPTAASEADRVAQQRHLEIEQLIEQDPEISGAIEEALDHRNRHQSVVLVVTEATPVDEGGTASGSSSRPQSSPSEHPAEFAGPE